LDWPGAGFPPLAHVDVHDGGQGHIHLDLRYMLRVSGDDRPRPPDSESPDVRWFDFDEAIGIADDGLIGLLRRERPVRP
jgi:hypothetical protein